MQLRNLAAVIIVSFALAAPVTVAQTTASSTTVAPSNEVPTTSAPTTSLAPNTSSAFVTVAPTTIAPTTNGSNPRPPTPTGTGGGIKAQVVIMLTISVDHPLSAAENTTMTELFYAQLINTFGEGYGEGYFTPWEINIVLIAEAKILHNISKATANSKGALRAPEFSYNIGGMTNVFEDGRFWSTAPVVQESFARELQLTIRIASIIPAELPFETDSSGLASVIVSTYAWPLIPGKTLFTFGYERPAEDATACSSPAPCTEGNSSSGTGGADGGGAVIEIELLIAIIIGAGVCVSITVFGVYRECSKILIGEVPGPTASNHDTDVEHVGNHEIAIAVDDDHQPPQAIDMAENQMNEIVWPLDKNLNQLTPAEAWLRETRLEEAKVAAQGKRRSTSFRSFNAALDSWSEGSDGAQRTKGSTSSRWESGLRRSKSCLTEGTETVANEMALTGAFESSSTREHGMRRSKSCITEGTETGANEMELMDSFEHRAQVATKINSPSTSKLSNRKQAEPRTSGGSHAEGIEMGTNQ